MQQFDLHFPFLAVLVAEVTQVSLGVGYEIGRAVAMDKNILCLYRPQQGKSEYAVGDHLFPANWKCTNDVGSSSRVSTCTEHALGPLVFSGSIVSALGPLVFSRV